MSKEKISNSSVAKSRQEDIPVMFATIHFDHFKDGEIEEMVNSANSHIDGFEKAGKNE